jgi:DNA-binding NarL/FixJ family response regulator
MAAATALLVVVTSAADADAMSRWLSTQLPDGHVTTAHGYYAGVAAIDSHCPAVVIDVGVPTGPDTWRLAELRVRQPDAAVVVVADAAMLSGLAATLRAHLAVTTINDLPPLRELLLTDEPLVRGDQTSSRRSRR